MNTPQSVSHAFISIILTIAKAYGMDLEAPYCCLRLEQEPYPALIVEKMGKSLLSVAKHYQEKGTQYVNPQVLFQIETQQEKECWFPVSLTQFGETCHIAHLDNFGYPIRYKQRGAKECLGLCDTWADELENQHWHVKSQPSPQVKAVGIKFILLAPGSVSPSWDEDDQPVLHLHGSYLIEGNKTGLLALMEAAATALTKQSQGTEEVFDANAYMHLLQVKLLTDGA